MKDFLSDLLGKTITTIRLCDTDDTKDTAEDKSNRVDVHVTIENQEQIIIEVQPQNKKDYFSRILYGTPKAITNHIQEADIYLKSPQDNPTSASATAESVKAATTSTRALGQNYGETLELYLSEKNGI